MADNTHGMKLPIVKEGHTAVLGGLVASTALLYSGGRFLRKAGLAALAATAGVAWFLRDPDRIVIPIDNGILAPADGRVIRIDTVTLPEFFKEPVRRISIFMSLFNCHVNRAPVSGRVELKTESGSSFMAAWDDRASEENRRVGLGIEAPVRTYVRQVAGLVARQIVCRPEYGDELKQGQRIGVIKFGSRVDVFFPTDLKLLIEIGDRTIAGVTALAERFREDGAR